MIAEHHRKAWSDTEARRADISVAAGSAFFPESLVIRIARYVTTPDCLQLEYSEFACWALAYPICSTITCLCAGRDSAFVVNAACCDGLVYEVCWDRYLVHKALYPCDVDMGTPSCRFKYCPESKNRERACECLVES